MILVEKASQVLPLLHETGLGAWLLFARETGMHPEPGVDLVVGADVVRPSAFLFGAGGQRIAIVARFDVSAVRDGGVFEEVIGYDEDIRDPLRTALARLDPASIGLNYSPDDVGADGLTHGMWLLLRDILAGTPWEERLTSAAGLLSRLRARKSPGEIARIRAAVALTETIVAELSQAIRPGVSELALHRITHERFQAHQVLPAWRADGCPIVNTGPESEPGHARPRNDLLIAPGHLVHMDLGITLSGYCSDLQRMWYVRRPGESGPPADVARAFAVVVEAIEAAFRVLQPGQHGFEVDQVAREVIVKAGYPEFKHGVGHGLGRAVHDGGTLLGPRWACYGKTTSGVVEAGNVYTLELGVPTSAGFVGLEEDVLVTPEGAVWLSTPQRELMLV